MLGYASSIQIKKGAIALKARCYQSENIGLNIKQNNAEQKDDPPFKKVKKAFR